MLKKSLCAHVLALAAGTMMLVPAMPVQAAPQAARQVRSGADVVLVKGELSGKLLTANGKAVEGASVVVAKNGKEVARTVTKADGSYTVKGLSNGSHVVSMSDAQIPVRLWSEGAAPAAAKTKLTVSQTAVRGQLLDDEGYPIVTNIVIAAVAVAAIIVAVDAQQEADDLQDQLDDMVSP